MRIQFMKENCQESAAARIKPGLDGGLLWRQLLFTEASFLVTQDHTENGLY